MSLIPEQVAVTRVIMAAWRCDACEVQGRSLADAAVTCWNCGGAVTITAMPSVPVDQASS